MAVPDPQHPFHHRDWFDFLSHVWKLFKCDTMILLGDEIDAHTLGRWVKDPDGLSAGQEILEATKCMQFYFKLSKQGFVCYSNHTARPYDRMFEAGVPEVFYRDIKEVLNAPKEWNWAHEWVIDNVVFEHGLGVSGKTGALRAAEQNRKSTVIGHLHSFAGITYSASKFSQIWGMNAGCGIDLDKYAFKYARANRIKAVLGTGLVLAGIPYFIPMILDKNKRWVRRV